MIIKMDSGIHYAKEVDENGKFIRWLPNPNGSYKERCKKLLDDVEKMDLNESEEKYFTSFKGQFENKGKLSLKQVAVLENIKEAHTFTEEDKEIFERLQNRWQ